RNTDEPVAQEPSGIRGAGPGHTPFIASAPARLFPAAGGRRAVPAPRSRLDSLLRRDPMDAPHARALAPATSGRGELLTGATMMSAAAAGLFRTGLIRPLSFAAGYTSREAAFMIMTYHRVNDEMDPFSAAVPTQVFEQHMTYLARTHTVLTVEELAERMRRGR